MDFVECDACRTKPGSPQLCNGCLRNRDTILELQEEIKLYKISYRVAVESLGEVIKDLRGTVKKGK